MTVASPLSLRTRTQRSHWSGRALSLLRMGVEMLG